MKNVMKLSVLSTLVLVGGMSLTALADGRGPGFDALDTNNDGKLTQAEVEARGAARFARADTNSDGLLSLEELQAAGREGSDKRAEKMIERLDANGDKLLSEEEIGKMRARGGGRMFKRADANGDGEITREEFDAAMAVRGDKRKPKH